MALHFSEDELAARRAKACAAMAQGGLDALLMFRQESMYYLTGYDSFGYVFFQCLAMTADGRLTLLTRSPDLRQARHTSMIGDVRIWVDLPAADPAAGLRDILDEFGLKGGRLGVEWDAYGLTAANGRRLDAALAGWAELDDASGLVSRLRAIKSPAEIIYVRRAAELADDALDAAVALARPGADEGDILAAMQGAVFKGGGDYPGNPFIIGSGRDALLCRTKTGRRKLGAADQLSLEWAGAYRHYHAAMFRVLVLGPATAARRRMYEASREALLAVEAELRPGRTFGDAFDAHARVLDKAGLKAHRLNACGYGLGATFAPNWMDWPMLHHGNPVAVAPDMTVFCHMIVFDSDNELAMALGETVLTTTGAPEQLSRSPLDLLIMGA